MLGVMNTRWRRSLRIPVTESTLSSVFTFAFFSTRLFALTSWHAAARCPAR